MSAGYPRHREADVVLADGRTVHVRPVRADDREGLLDMLKSLSIESRQLRFFSPSVNLERVVDWAADVDYGKTFGLVATAGIDERIIGHATWYRTADDRAEVAFTIRDEYQGKGLGSILLGHLAEAAHEAGIPVFHADILPQNHRMIGLFKKSGFPVEVKSYPGEIVVTLPTSISPEALERFEKREQRSAVAALRGFFSPRSIAVIGASRSRDTIGGEIFHNLVSRGFNGPVFPVNPKADVVQSVPAYGSVADVPGDVDLGVITVPAETVLDVARDCAAKRVRSVLVISAGFSDAGDEGERRERELMTLCRRTGMRLIGPNCMGLVNTDPDVSLDATFAPGFPRRSRIGFLSQGGALGLAVLDYVDALGLGLSTFASLGNKADISGNDLIHYWESDDATDLILLYLESFGNPRKFARITRRVGRRKPVVAVKSGRRTKGKEPGRAALIPSSDAAVDALFHQAGVIRTNTLSEMFDVASLLGTQPAPHGNRVAILSNASGSAALCADACEADGLDVVGLPEETRRKLAELFPGRRPADNPVSIGYTATGESYRAAIEALAGCDEIDALIVIFIPPLVTKSTEVAAAIREAVASLPRRIPVASVFMSARGVPRELESDGVRVPSYAFPEDAARALARAARYGIWRDEPPGTVPSFEDARRDEAAAVIAEALADGHGIMTPHEVARLFDCYGLALVGWRLASTPEEAAEAAAELGGPVALKVHSEVLVDKADAGGVRLDLSGGDLIAAEAERMQSAVEAAGHEVHGFLVQRMAPQGVEVIVTMTHDAALGPVLACAAGGVEMELLEHAAVRLTPLSDKEASEMVRSLKTFPLLQGFRGRPKADVDALEDLLLRIGALVETHHEVVALDCNPVMVLSEGAVVVDARVRIEAAEPERPIAARRPFL